MSNGTRYPGTGASAYGAPPPPSWPDPIDPHEFTPLVPNPGVHLAPNGDMRFVLQPPKKLRVSVRRESDTGELKIKIMVDGVVIAEGISDGTTLTIEKEI